jgi:hypothetical protein
MNIRRRPFTAVALAATATLALSACGSLDTGEVEKTIVKDAKDRDVTLRDVHCDETKAEVGAAIRCTAKADEFDEKIRFTGKITGEKDGGYEYEYRTSVDE